MTNGNNGEKIEKNNKYYGSKIEIEFCKFLQEYKIRYIREVEFKWLEKYRYDFYLIDYDIIVELHGIQHYQSVDVFGGMPAYQKRKITDALKEIKAKENGYIFLSISYKRIENTNQYKIIILRKILELTKNCNKRIKYKSYIKHNQQ